MRKPSISIHECCETLRANQIPKCENVLRDEINAGMHLEWATPSVSRRFSSNISRAGFYKWVKSFYGLDTIIPYSGGETV